MKKKLFLFAIVLILIVSLVPLSGVSAQRAAPASSAVMSAASAPAARATDYGDRGSGNGPRSGHNGNCGAVDELQGDVSLPGSHGCHQFSLFPLLRSEEGRRSICQSTSIAVRLVARSRSFC